MDLTTLMSRKMTQILIFYFNFIIDNQSNTYFNIKLTYIALK